MKTTRLQVNAVIALVILACLSGGFMLMLFFNELAPHEHQAIVALLSACIFAVVHIARTWADDNPPDK